MFMQARLGKVLQNYRQTHRAKTMFKALLRTKLEIMKLKDSKRVQMIYFR